mmetsp:Transcript_42057/g.107542  ORF Transcript_42057/g.107542 Transcript_42057/m.107542 type:complete len:451 (+) Transcript_42057:2797-4149(+)
MLHLFAVFTMAPPAEIGEPQLGDLSPLRSLPAGSASPGRAAPDQDKCGGVALPRRSPHAAGALPQHDVRLVAVAPQGRPRHLHLLPRLQARPAHHVAALRLPCRRTIHALAPGALGYGVARRWLVAQPLRRPLRPQVDQERGPQARVRGHTSRHGPGGCRRECRSRAAVQQVARKREVVPRARVAHQSLRLPKHDGGAAARREVCHGGHCREGQLPATAQPELVLVVVPRDNVPRRGSIARSTASRSKAALPCCPVTFCRQVAAVVAGIVTAAGEALHPELCTAAGARQARPHARRVEAQHRLRKGGQATGRRCLPGAHPAATPRAAVPRLRRRQQPPALAAREPGSPRRRAQAREPPEVEGAAAAADGHQVQAHVAGRAGGGGGDVAEAHEQVARAARDGQPCVVQPRVEQEQLALPANTGRPATQLSSPPTAQCLRISEPCVSPVCAL